MSKNRGRGFKVRGAKFFSYVWMAEMHCLMDRYRSDVYKTFRYTDMKEIEVYESRAGRGDSFILADIVG